MRIGILTAGGDCPGLNAAIRGIGKTAILQYGMEVYGISSGFLGLINNEYVRLDEATLSGILTVGGTILGTSREKPFNKNELPNPNEVNKPKLIKKHYDEMGFDCLVCAGGNGTQKTAALLSESGMNVIGIPKTIDNDVWGTDITFGFDSAVNIATEAIDRLHTTANSHKRIMVIEVMGHNAGWIALYSGIAGGGDVILIPEIEYDEKIICDYLVQRAYKKKNSSIVVIAEGIRVDSKKKRAGTYIAKMINEKTGIETRETILGYVQRGGSPSPMDRVLATQYGAYAAELIAQKKFGVMVAMKNNKITDVSLNDVGGKTRTVDPEHSLILQARSMETCFGDGK
ncbi:MAG: 6-phosphofructokinase [Bacteroidetes bacterium RIFOXYA12_FULL_35_11]|nr:MAG: 6-phosphofructokinase [Bacteroidetes bacterium GWF2_35_48]OFY76505.1 MAG: 6-phosphofructokinase [Bacteroidetes bacterium RIFOXYA12_FULL_35_11]OFY95666.1 MAG: 6-phosphofructokinase [Bacteroidetes bacterium RIFOXYB2_FULL_35_7]OFY95829.1 MAG: 6-phosphofructokinase [Bacteroidetes bacterium RIFOXYC12_FULL_35_7]HBX51416.1 6-phosphofructokinase [Bacteroidales bacterium]